MEGLREILLKYKIQDLKSIICRSSLDYYISNEEQLRNKYEAIKIAFQFHYDLNKTYREMCNNWEFTPSSLKSYIDLEKIPLIPIDYFLSSDIDLLMTLPYKYKQVEFHVTGNNGEHAKVYRDSFTNDLSIMSIAMNLTEILDTRSSPSPIVVFFTPPILSAPNLGMLRGLGILGSIYADRFYVVDSSNEFKFKETADFIINWAKKVPIYLVGPPFIINYFLEYLKANRRRLELSHEDRLITIGGWKKANGSMILRSDFTEKCEQWLTINEKQIRDIYGFIETNLMAIECSLNKKHIPSHIHVYSRSLLNNEINRYEEGTICVLDPTILTYPCFLQTRDVGVISDIDCICGRKGTSLDLIGKTTSNNEINCSITLEQYLAGISKQLSYGY